MSWSKGERAEDYVASKLSAKGWTIEARNYRRRGFELDIIASQADRLLCIEVKARRRQANEETHYLDPRKLQRTMNGMRHWLQHHCSRDEKRNTEFWLCLVFLPVDQDCVRWQRWEGNGAE